MAIINYTNQLKFTGSGPLDVKNTPVRTYSELPSVPAQRYVGMEVTVLNGSGGKPEEYWFIGKDKFNGTWVRKIEGFGLNLSDDGVLTLTYNGEGISGSNTSFKSYIEESIKQWGDDNYIESGEVKFVNDVPVLSISYKDTEKAPLEIPLGVFATKEYVDSEIEKIIATSGAQGDKGVQGDAGDKGVQGEAGDKGAQGEPGVMGLQGFMGIQGEKGTQADRGAQGEQGVQGEKGDSGEGLTYIDEDE